MKTIYNLISTIIPIEYLTILKLNIYFNSFFNDAASVYMLHLVEFHNQVMTYLVIMLVVICVVLFNLFRPLLQQHLTRRSLYVSFASFVSRYIGLPLKIVTIYSLYKLIT